MFASSYRGAAKVAFAQRGSDLKSESLFERKITAGKENYERTREKKYAVARVAESGEKTEREKEKERIL